MKTNLFWAYTIKTLLIILAYGIVFWGSAAWLCGADPQLTYWQTLLTTHIIIIGIGLFLGLLYGFVTLWFHVNETIEKNRYWNRRF